MRRAEDLNERDIGALRKERMMFELRPEPGEVVSLDIIDEEHAMRIADIDHGWRAERGILDRAERDHPRVVERLAERNFLPARPCRW